MKLWKVFWIYNILVGTVIGLAIDYIPDTNMALILAVGAVTLIWVVWVTVSIWTCAFNTSWRGWGYMARIYALLSIALVVLLVFGLATGLDS